MRQCCLNLVAFPRTEIQRVDRVKKEAKKEALPPMRQCCLNVVAFPRTEIRGDDRVIMKQKRRPYPLCGYGIISNDEIRP